jgi:hypothetical protein
MFLTNHSVEQYLKRLLGLGKTEIQDGLQRLDMLTKEETGLAVARNLVVTHDVDGNVKTIKEVTQDMDNTVKATQDLTRGVDCNVKAVGGDVKEARELIQDVDGGVKVVEQVTRSIDDNVKILIEGAQTFLPSYSCQSILSLCQNSNE